MVAWRRASRRAAGGSKSGGGGGNRRVDWLVVGLGNPGKKYERTRHNAGFAAVNELAQRTGAGSFLSKFDGQLAFTKVAGHDVGLLLPLTYMNLSGQSVRPAMVSLCVDPDHLLVVHDEVDLAEGMIRIKSGGGLAGHNGLKSIAQLVKTQEFLRVRIGVGRPGPDDRRPVADWVLGPFERDSDTVSIYRAAADAAERVISDGPAAAMNIVN